jgi:hypothetical protein
MSSSSTSTNSGSSNTSTATTSKSRLSSLSKLRPRTTSTTQTKPSSPATHVYPANKVVSHKVVRDVFKGYPTIAIWNVDANGSQIGKAPLISFGYNKARAILDEIDEIREWCSEQEEAKELAAKTSATATVTLSKSRINVDELSDQDIVDIQARLQSRR